MSSRYPKRKRAAIDYAAIASGNAQAPRAPKTTSKAQVLRIPGAKKRQATSPKPPSRPSKSSKVPKAPKASQAPKVPKRPVVERPEPEPLDQNSDGGPDPPSPDPDVDPAQLSATTATHSSSTFALPTSSSSSSAEPIEQQKTPPPTAEPPHSTARSIFDPAPDAELYWAAREQDPGFWDLSDEDEDEDDYPDTSAEPFPEPGYSYSYSDDNASHQPRQTDPFSELTVQEVVDLVGTVIYFVRAVKRIRIDVADPVSVARELDSRDRLWDDPARNWAKYADRAWRHRWHVADRLYELPLGYVAALVDVVIRFKERLSDKGVQIGL